MVYSSVKLKSNRGSLKENSKMVDDRFDPDAEWNKNIVRNLKYKFPEALNNNLVNDRELLKRFFEWTGEMCLSENEDGFLGYLKTGE